MARLGIRAGGRANDYSPLRVERLWVHVMVLFVGKEIPLHVAHLEARMRQTGDWRGEAPLTENDAAQRLHQAIHDLDIEAAKKDVSPFLRDKTHLELWSHDFFRAIAEMIRFV